MEKLDVNLTVSGCEWAVKLHDHRLEWLIPHEYTGMCSWWNQLNLVRGWVVSVRRGGGQVGLFHSHQVNHRQHVVRLLSHASVLWHARGHITLWSDAPFTDQSPDDLGPVSARGQVIVSSSFKAEVQIIKCHIESHARKIYVLLWSGGFNIRVLSQVLCMVCSAASLPPWIVNALCELFTDKLMYCVSMFSFLINNGKVSWLSLAWWAAHHSDSLCVHGSSVT